MESKLLQEQEIIQNLGKYSTVWKIVGLNQFIEKGIRRLPILNRTKTKKFERLLDEFKPDLVLFDSPTELGASVAKKKIPLLTYFWDDWAFPYTIKEFSNPIHFRMFLMTRNHIVRQCLKKSTIILSETDSISNSIKKHYPKKRVITFPYSGIDTDYWKRDGEENAMELRRPCVGFVQHAKFRYKAKEMLVLSRVMSALPDVTFYWAGDGPYRNDVLSALSKFDNFEWLGSLEYPGEVKAFLSSIEICGLASGQEMSPYALKHAMSMEKPVIATDVGGVHESMKDKKAGFLVKEGDYKEWIQKISLLIDNPEKAYGMGRYGRRFTQENWDSRLAAEKLAIILKGIRSK